MAPAEQSAGAFLWGINPSPLAGEGGSREAAEG